MVKQKLYLRICSRFMAIKMEVDLAFRIICMLTLLVSLIVIMPFTTDEIIDIVVYNKRPRCDDLVVDNEKKKCRTHEILQPCNDCPKQCTTKFLQAERTEMHSDYWTRPLEQRRVFLYSNIISTNRTDKRQIRYFMLKGQPVCKTFFLSTLGYKTDQAVINILKAGSPDKLFPAPSKWGKHKPKHAYSDDLIKRIDSHILKHNPTCSHYRRENSPHRLYLPNTFTIKKMLEHFKEDNPEL